MAYVQVVWYVPLSGHASLSCLSHATLYSGLREYGLLFPAKYLQPAIFIAPLNLLEEFSKPLSLSFRLLGNILADELTLSVLYSLVPF